MAGWLAGCVFDADDPSPLVRFLERDPNIEVVEGADEILIRPRSAPK